MDDCFSSFHLLNLLGVKNIKVTGILYKNRLQKCSIIGGKQLEKKVRGHFEQHTWSKKQFNFD